MNPAEHALSCVCGDALHRDGCAYRAVRLWANINTLHVHMMCMCTFVCMVHRTHMRAGSPHSFPPPQWNTFGHDILKRPFSPGCIGAIPYGLSHVKVNTFCTGCAGCTGVCINDKSNDQYTILHTGLLKIGIFPKCFEVYLLTTLISYEGELLNYYFLWICSLRLNYKNSLLC